MDQQQLSSSGIEKKKRKCVRNKFQYEWLSMNIFKDWLASHENDEKALCTACNKILICGKSNLISHSKTEKHVENMKSRNITLSVLLPVKHNNIYVDHVTKVKIAEIKLAAFYATHNIAFEVVNDMVPLLKNIFTDSQIAKDLTLSRTKCRQIITNILAKRESEKLINNLLNNKFSILLDESTSITNDKMLCILVKYFSIENKTVITQLLELVSLDATDCSAEKLYSAFEQCFKSKRIPMSNIVGMASDNASVMIGDNNSFKSRLKKEVPALIVLKCICHSSALIASKACAKLPDSCENLLHAVATYFSGSAKRSAILYEFQTFFGVASRKILKLSGTRWLVLQKCVERLLDNWEVLKHYFNLEAFEHKNNSRKSELKKRMNTNGNGKTETDFSAPEKDYKEISLDNLMTLDSIDDVAEDKQFNDKKKVEVKGETTSEMQKSKGKQMSKVGAAYIKRVEVQYCEHHEIYLPRSKNIERAITLHCPT
ncbi:uncharacterized protein LOC116853266 [Odontomachus brunneus]|uniref:uncharacterized protein LOC116853266 n=1 Tax=Odontomachus brunneus TaxID=486640 RepID=UPI0013F1E5FA|nr:uncharacterized protein LOC116853266 [Odontomachus brunneus]